MADGRVSDRLLRASLLWGFMYATQARMRWETVAPNLDVSLALPPRASVRGKTMRALHWMVERYAKSWRVLESASTYVDLAKTGGGDQLHPWGLQDASSLLSTLAGASLRYLEGLLPAAYERINELPARKRIRWLNLLHTGVPVARAGFLLPNRLRPKLVKTPPVPCQVYVAEPDFSAIRALDERQFPPTLLFATATRSTGKGAIAPP